MNSILTFTAVILVVFGMVFFTGGTVGILRMPDFYSRLHPAGKLDSLGMFCCLLGLALYNLSAFSPGHFIMSLKILLIIMFIYITSPTATHALADSGIRAGLDFWRKKRNDGQ